MVHGYGLINMKKVHVSIGAGILFALLLGNGGCRAMKEGFKASNEVNLRRLAEERWMPKDAQLKARIRRIGNEMGLLSPVRLLPVRLICFIRLFMPFTGVIKMSPICWLILIRILNMPINCR